MEQGQLSWITNYIWGIVDDGVRDLYVRGKYRDVILPMTVLRRLDAVLEDTHQAVLDMRDSLDKAGVREAAERLPDDIDEQELIDDTDVPSDGEEVPANDLDAIPQESDV